MRVAFWVNLLTILGLLVFGITKLIQIFFFPDLNLFFSTTGAILGFPIGTFMMIGWIKYKYGTEAFAYDAGLAGGIVLWAMISGGGFGILLGALIGIGLSLI